MVRRLNCNVERLALVFNKELREGVVLGNSQGPHNFFLFCVILVFHY